MVGTGVCTPVLGLRAGESHDSFLRPRGRGAHRETRRGQSNCDIDDQDSTRMKFNP